MLRFAFCLRCAVHLNVTSSFIPKGRKSLESGRQGACRSDHLIHILRLLCFLYIKTNLQFGFLFGGGYNSEIVVALWGSLPHR